MDRRDNPYAAPEPSTTSAVPASEGAGRIAKGLRDVAFLCAAMTPLAFVTLVLMLISAFENEQYAYGGTLMGEQSGVRMFIRMLFFAWFSTAAVTVVAVAWILSPSASDRR